MIVATVASILLMAVARDDRHTGYVAGVLAALSLAIGFEALPVIAFST